MRKQYSIISFLSLLIAIMPQAFSQNVGIGTASPSQKLHVGGNLQTIRIDGLTSVVANQFAGVGVNFVYATANGELTVKPPVSAPTSDWTLYGNTIAGGEFIGTINGMDWIIRTNNSERARFTSAGNFGIGTTTPAQILHVIGTVRVSTLGGTANVGTPNAFATTDVNGDLGRVNAAFPTAPGDNLELWFRPSGAPYIQPVSNYNIRVYDVSPTQPYGIYYDGASNTVGGYFRTQSTAAQTAAVQGFSDVTGNQTYGYLGYNSGTGEVYGGQTLYGYAVYGKVEDPGRIALFGRTTLNASYAACIGYSDVWIGGYYFVDDISSAYNPPSLYGQLITSSAAALDYQSAIMSYAQYTGAGNPGYTIGGRFQAVAGTQDGWGVQGYYSGTGVFRFGGYFFATNGATSNYLQVADNTNNRKAVGSGANVSEVIPTLNHGRIMLSTPECPEYLYYDYGTVQLVNGSAHVELDPILVDIIVVDQNNPIKVFPQPNIPDCNGLAVINKTATGFDLIEVNGGTSSGEVDYMIVVKPKTNFGEGRFPQGPGPFSLKQQDEPPASFTKNPGQKNTMYRWPNDWDVYGYDPMPYIKQLETPPSASQPGSNK